MDADVLIVVNLAGLQYAVALTKLDHEVIVAQAGNAVGSQLRPRSPRTQPGFHAVHRWADLDAPALQSFSPL